MEVGVRTVKPQIVVKRIGSSQQIKTPILQHANSLQLPKPNTAVQHSKQQNPCLSPEQEEEKEQIKAIDSDIDKLFSRLAQLNSEISGQSTLTETTTKGSTGSHTSTLSSKKSFEIVQTKESRAIPITQSLSINHFLLGGRLGQGKFGQVHQLIHKQTGMIYALKKIYKSLIQEHKMEQNILNQIDCLKQCQHPNIIKLYGGFTDQYHIFLVTQYIHGDTIQKNYGMDQTIVARILQQLLRALSHLHDKKIVHRDIKPENIIYSEGVVKLCDFGWATSYKNQFPRDFCGTLDYVAPEVIEQLPYESKVDMWCVGILCFEMLTGHVPFKDASRQQHMKNITSCDKYDLLYPSWMPANGKDFISRLLRKNPLQRMSARDALNHPFLVQNIKPDLVQKDIANLM